VHSAHHLTCYLTKVYFTV